MLHFKCKWSTRPVDLSNHMKLDPYMYFNYITIQRKV